MAASTPLGRFMAVLWGDWQTNALWQRILKYSLAGTLAVVIAILPRFQSYSAFLAPMVVVFAHPGQRMGVMVEALLMIIFGSLLGLSWSLLGLYLSSLVEDANPAAASTVRALFLLVCVLLHGFVRSSSPRLFNLVLFLLLAALLVTHMPPSSASTSLYMTIFIPVLIGSGVLVVVNVAVFPETSSSYLGTSTIDTLSTTMDTLTRATYWFTTPGGDPPETGGHPHSLRLTATARTSGSVSRARGKFRRCVRKLGARFPNPFRTTASSTTLSNTPIHLSTLVQLAEQKSKLRSQLTSCRKAQDEVDFEVSIAPLAPATMNEISVVFMARLVQNTVTLIGACENKYIFINDEDVLSTGYDESVEMTPRKEPVVMTKYTQSTPSCHETRSSYGRFVDENSELLLDKILERIRAPVQEFQTSMKEAVDLLICCLAYCFDVATLPSGSPTPRGIHLAEIDIHVDQFTASIAALHEQSAEELKIAVMGDAGEAVDFMPRMETFLVSSFLLAFRASADQILEMLRHARKLVDKRQRRHDRCRIWVPQLRDFRKWLATAGETDAMVLPEEANKAARQGLKGAPGKEQQQHDSLNDVDTSPAARDEEAVPGTGKTEQQRPHQPASPGEEECVRSKRKKTSNIHGCWLSGQASTTVRAAAADAIEWVKDSDHVAYATKLAIAVFLVTWPALIASWNGWYEDVKGVWAPMQLILVFEVAIGTSLFVFVVRLFGVIFGCLVGYLSVEIGRGHRGAAVIILAMGIVPSVYVQVATKYVKAGMISIVSMAVVALAAVNDVGAASEIFCKRLVAFLVGGVVAMLVEALILPVRARDRLVESLSASVRQIQKMQAALAVGIDDPHRPNFRSRKLRERFGHCRDKAQAALGAAETFLPFCLTEPRLKGSFRPLAPTYRQIIYILRQMADQMDCMIQLRSAYGSSVLEDLNPQVHVFRRGVAASSTLMLFSVNEALTTWLPLPQFLPSARLAQLRLIIRVRELLTAAAVQTSTGSRTGGDGGRRTVVTEETADMITQQKFLSWNATTAGQMEIIEYLEELVRLVKMLVGVDAFQSGVLERPQHRRYGIRPGSEQDEDWSRVALAQGRYLRGGRRQGAHDEVGGNRLRRAATATAAAVGVTAGTHPHAGGRDADGGSEAESEDGDGLQYTQMLRRVGTGLRRNDVLVRRRTMTTSYAGGGY